MFGRKRPSNERKRGYIEVSPESDGWSYRCSCGVSDRLGSREDAVAAAGHHVRWAH